MIKDVKLLQIYNSRGDPTLEISVKTQVGWFSASTPSGKSISTHEASALDIKEIVKIFPTIKKNFISKKENLNIVDKKLIQIGGKEFENIGGNLAIALSAAVLKAVSKGDVYKFLNSKANAFPYPLGNVIGGGAHGGGTDIQEFLVLPVKAKTMQEAIETNFSVWTQIGRFFKSKGVFGRNDEGAWVSSLNNTNTLDLVCDIAEQFDARVGIDLAASQLYENGHYKYLRYGRHFSTKEQIDFVADLVKTYNLIYVEDPFNENDFASFSELRKKTKCIICGDDIFATNPERLKLGIKKRAGNAVIIKPNQAGTISRTLETVKTAKRGGFVPVVSHRSGETNDTLISDLAVGIGSPIIKCGIAGGERVAKLNRLIEIWSDVRNPKMAKLKTI